MPHKVVIIDDDSNIRNIFKKMVEKAGYEALPVESAEDAITLSKEHKIAVYVVDMNLPGMTGEEFIDTHDLGTSVAFMVTATNINQDFIANMFAKGMVFVLRKPVTAQMFMVCITKAVSLHILLETNKQQQSVIEETAQMSEDVSEMLEDVVQSIKDTVEGKDSPNS